MQLPPHLTAGILLLAACPVGDIANFFTLLAGGNLVLSVTVNTLSCLFCVGTMAFAFALYDHLLGQPFEFALPTWALVLRLMLMVALPVLAGMAVRRWKPAWAAAYRKILRNICLAGTGFLVVYVLFNRWAQVAADWRQTTLASLAFMVTAFAVSLVLSRLLRLSAVDGITLGILFAVRNVAIAMAIAVTLLNRTEFAEVSVVYFLAEVPLLLGTVGVYRRWWAGLPTGART
jgi:BASS family bile acid:Na+ symporter